MLALIRRATYNMPTNNDIADVIYSWYARAIFQHVCCICVKNMRADRDSRSIERLEIFEPTVTLCCEVMIEVGQCLSTSTRSVFIQFGTNREKSCLISHHVFCNKHFIKYYGDRLPNFKYDRTTQNMK